MKTKESAKRYVAKDNVSIYYWNTWRKGMTGAYRVLHPGAAVNHSSLEHLEAEFNQRQHQTIIFDPRGSGYSDAPIRREHHSIGANSGDLEGILTQEGIEAPVLVGHSFGFMASADYAARSGNAHYLVGICSSHKFQDTAPNRLLFQLFDKVIIYTEWLGSIGTLLQHRFQGTQRPECVDMSTEQKSDLQAWLEIVDIPLRVATAHAWGQREVNKWDITRQLSQFSTPILLIYGGKDMMVRPVAGEHIRARTSALCTVHTFPEGRHTLPTTHPREVAALIEFYTGKH